MKLKTNNMVLCGVFAVVIAILAQISIPIKSVPVTLLTFIVSITGIILASKKAFISTLISALLSIVGMSVFAGHSNEIGKLILQTGTVLLAYTLMAYIVGYASESYSSYVYILLAMIIGLVIVYLTKTLIFVAIDKIGIYESFSVYVSPYISSDMMEILVATWIGLAIRDKMNLKLSAN